MTTETTCKVYWTSIDDAVYEVDIISSTCDSTLTQCTLHGSNGASESVTCNSELNQSSSTDYEYAQCFCACGDNTVSVPSTVSCTDKCYDMSTSFSCNYVTLSTGFTVGSPQNGILQDQCLKLRCTQDGTKCTDDGSVEWTCDDKQYDAPGATSTKSYVCNCNGAAAIPSLYQSNGKSTGTACGGGSTAGNSAAVSPAAQSNTPAPTPVMPSIASTTTTATTPITTSMAGLGSPQCEPGLGLLALLLVYRLL